MRRHGEIADAEHFAVLDDTHLRDRRELPGEHELRVVGGRSALLERPCPGRAGRHHGPARTLERRDAAGVIVVRVRVQDQLDVGGPEADLADVLVNHGR